MSTWTIQSQNKPDKIGFYHAWKGSHWFLIQVIEHHGKLVAQEYVLGIMFNHALYDLHCYTHFMPIERPLPPKE